MTSSSSHHIQTLILGAGLAGLSAGYHLKNRSALIVEREKEVGGTARSFTINGFTFDFTGHLLHLHTPYTKKLITKLLRNNFYSCVRNAWIYSHQTYTRYPYQANTYGLPNSVIDDCVLGFFAVQSNSSNKSIDYTKISLGSWSRQTFGPGISRHFMNPYNQKLYQTPVQQLTADWCGPFVPQPKLEDVIRGALLPQEKQFGYNTTFLYPKSGGIQAVAEALSREVPRIKLRSQIKFIDFKKREALLSDGQLIHYEYFINTIPLPEFLKLLKPIPGFINQAQSKLRSAGILCLNIGVKRPRISDKSWIYFPEENTPFYRVGFPMNFTPHAVPRGCSSMYVEIPFSRTRGLSKSQILKQVRSGLITTGILRKSDQLPVVQFLPIKYAYVVYNKNRRPALNKIFNFFNRNRIKSIGRYGAWKYSFMEAAILDGREAANEILSK